MKMRRTGRNSTKHFRALPRQQEFGGHRSSLAKILDLALQLWEEEKGSSSRQECLLK
jgi:hypothetical protein